MTPLFLNSLVLSLQSLGCSPKGGPRNTSSPGYRKAFGVGQGLEGGETLTCHPMWEESNREYQGARNTSIREPNLFSGMEETSLQSWDLRGQLFWTRCHLIILHHLLLLLQWLLFMSHSNGQVLCAHFIDGKTKAQRNWKMGHCVTAWVRL
jgi:hypothetical protein